MTPHDERRATPAQSTWRATPLTVLHPERAVPVPPPATPGRMLRVTLLGAPKLATALGPIAPSKPIVYAATLYLGVNRGRATRRAELARVLWPDEDEGIHGERVRWLVYQLKRAGLSFPPRDPELTIPSSEVALDTDVLSGTRWTDEVLATAPGDVLAGYDPQISDTFARWVIDTRDAIGARVMHDLGRWLAAARAEMNVPRAEALARRLLELDPFHEGASIALAEALAVQGRRVAAVELLGRHSQVERAGAVVASSAQIRARLREHRQAALEAEQAPREAGALVGRQTILSRIVDSTDGAVTMRIGLAGPAGIGKTRLLDEVHAIASLRGVQVLRLRCAREDALRPRSLVTDLVRALLDARGGLGAAPATLDLLRPIATEPGRAAAIPTATLYTAVAELLGAIAEDGPLTIMVDDIHRAESSSWAILSPLFPLVSSNPVTWLVALGADTMEEAARRFLTIFPPDEAMSDQTRDLIWLPPLADDAVVRLCVARAAPREVPDEVLARIVRDSVGVPFFAEALLEHWRRHADFTETPAPVSRLVAARLDRLGATGERVLAAIAVLGPDATLPAVEAVAMLGRPALLAGTRTLEAAGILGIENGVLCAPELWCDTVARRATPITWQLLHRTAGEWLEHEVVVSRRLPASTLERIALHWAQADEGIRAELALQRAARPELAPAAPRAVLAGTAQVEAVDDVPVAAPPPRATRNGMTLLVSVAALLPTALTLVGPWLTPELLPCI